MTKAEKTKLERELALGDIAIKWQQVALLKAQTRKAVAEAKCFEKDALKRG